MKKINLPSGLLLLLGVSLVVLLTTIAMPIIAIRASSKEEPTPEVEESSKVKDLSIELDGKSTVKVFITSENIIKEVDLEEYVASVVSSEMPASFDLEALKAQSIAARTYVAAKKNRPCDKAVGIDVCDTVHCQVYMTKESRLSQWKSAEAQGNWNKIEEATKGTVGKVLSYDNELVMYPQFFSTSSGKTEKAVDVFSSDVPYLVSTDSGGEEIAPKFKSDKPINIDEFINTVNTNYPKAGLTKDNIKSNIEILSRSDSGGVKEIRLGSEKVKGTEFRMLLKLNSTNFEFTVGENEVQFNCKGYGHGVGMSQWGANVMGKSGKSYDDILKHYYTGVNIVDLKFKTN
ncbi:MAG: stage II sporulation protein D [Clostridium sp.]